MQTFKLFLMYICTFDVFAYMRFSCVPILFEIFFESDDQLNVLNHFVCKKKITQKSLQSSQKNISSQKDHDYKYLRLCLVCHKFGMSIYQLSLLNFHVYKIWEIKYHPAFYSYFSYYLFKMMTIKYFILKLNNNYNLLIRYINLYNKRFYKIKNVTNNQTK